MDPTLITAIVGVVTALAGGGGVQAYYQIKKNSETSLATTEVDASSATTASWVAVNAYWEKELERTRQERVKDIEALRSERARDLTEWRQQAADFRHEIKELKTEVASLQKQRDDDLDHIDNLEAHIWKGENPPPPARRSR